MAKGDVGIGTIVGSAVFNILVIIGLCALLCDKVLLAQSTDSPLKLGILDFRLTNFLSSRPS